MIRLVFGILVAGLVFGCDTEEPNPAGILSSLDRNRGEAPAGVTIQDVDIIKDGVIDIEDLFAVVHFYEQEVPESVAQDEDETADSDTDDESAPCRNMESRFPEMDHVTDNSNYRQIFDLEGKKYVYALLGLQKKWITTMLTVPRKYRFATCVAVRFLLNDNLIPIRVKVKPVAGNEFSQPIISPLLEITPLAYTASGLQKEWDETEQIHYLIYHSMKLREGRTTKPLWWVAVNRDFDSNYRRKLRNNAVGLGSVVFTDEVGIPIGDNSVIVNFSVRLPEHNYPSLQKWEINSRKAIRLSDFMDPFYGDSPNAVDGVYVNISPTEVRQRYFPEDL